MHKLKVRLVVITGLLAVCFGVQTTAADWPQFRGPNGLGISSEKGLPVAWGPQSNIAWKVAVPGDDTVTSSPIVSGGNIILTYAVKNPLEHHVLCLKAADGSTVWDAKVEPGPQKKTDGRAGFAASTPCTDGKNVYVAFGSGKVGAVDLKGKVLWQNDIPNFGFDCAMSVSPVVCNNALIMLYDRSNDKKSITAYDREKGTVLWDEPRSGVSFGHSTPAIVEVKKKSMLLVSANGRAQGIDPANGKVTWWCKADGDVSSPAFGDGLMYCDGGRGGPGTVVDVTGEGDVSQTNVKWQKKIGASFGSPVIFGGNVYRVAGGKLNCVKAATGDSVCIVDLPGTRDSCSPFVTADGILYAASAGKGYAVKVGAACEIVGTSDLGDGSQASPAAAGGRIYLRGAKNLWCAGKGK